MRRFKTPRVPEPIVIALLVVFAAGCALLGLERPESFTERLAYAYSTHTAIVAATAESVAAADITVEAAESIAEGAREARELLDGARAVNDLGNSAEAGNRLALATTILDRLRGSFDDDRIPGGVP